MKKNRKHLIFFIMIIICIILWNQIIFLKYGISLFKYLKYSLPITKEEKMYLKRCSPIILGSDITAPPISYFDETEKKYTGLIVDYVNFLSIEMETTILIKMYTFHNLVEALRNNEINVCDMFPSEGREEEFQLSIPIYKLKTVIISPQKKQRIDNILELAGKNVAIPKSDLAAEYINEFLKHKNKIKANFIMVDDTKTVLEFLQKGIVDAAIGDEVVVSNFWKEFDVYETKKYNIVYLYEKDVVLAVNKESKILLSILNKGILKLKKNDMISKIQRKWFGISDSIKSEKKDLEFFVTIVFILFLCLISLYIWNYILKKKVLEKTREIEENKKNINIILNNLNTALFIINENYIIMECNDASSSLLFQDKKYIIGRSIFYFSFLKSLVKESKIFQWEKKINIKFINTINDKCYEVKIFSYISKEEKFKIISIEDITEKIILERKIHQENKMITIGQISAGLAHEIRNPLGIIRNGIFLFKMKTSTDVQEKAINMVENSIQRINNLIEHLLCFSRISSEKYTQENIKILIENIITVMESKLKSKNINCQVFFKGDIRVTLNVETINIILINLIENSIDALPLEREGNYIKLFVSSNKNFIKFSFEDNGIGISEEKLSHIFEPFYTTKEEGCGTGLGLYLVYNEVKKYNGDIHVKSQLGVGTTFSIIIQF